MSEGEDSARLDDHEDDAAVCVISPRAKREVSIGEVVEISASRIRSAYFISRG